MTNEQINAQAAAVPVQERPVPPSEHYPFAAFLGIYGGEHIAATEFVIGALLVTWGVRAWELIAGLVVGNLLAASSYALVTAPIAVDTRLSLFAYLRKVTGPWFQRIFNAAWGVVSIVWASSMMAISASSLKAAVGLPVQLEWYPTSGACVALTLVLVAVTVLVGAYGFKGVVRFSSLCVPWMAVIFFCGAAVGVPMLAKATGFGQVEGLSGFMKLLDAQVFNGAVPDGCARLSWIHVAAFSWMCGFVYHVGLNDMAIFRYARKASYGWVGLFGMFLGHFFAWICAGVMGAAAAAVLKTELNQLDSGAVTATVFGWSGLFAVVVAGWTTATPNIYRAALSFATFFPRAGFRRLAFGVGAVIAICSCFPGVMRIDMIANIAALLVPSVGAICLVEHWLFPRLGWVRHWNLYRGRRLNPAALAAWITASLFALTGAMGGWMHPFFLPIPTFLMAGVAYFVFAGLMGAREPIAPERQIMVDAVEARIAELAEEAATHPGTVHQNAKSPSHPGTVPKSAKSLSHPGTVPQSAKLPVSTVFAVLSWIALAALMVGACCFPESFRGFSVWCTVAYFSFAVLAAKLKFNA